MLAEPQSPEHDRAPEARPATRRARFERARVRGEELEFTTPGGLAKAIDDGCFYLEIPSEIDLAPAIRLSKEFYLERSDDSQYRGFKDLSGVYFDREHFQTEHVLVDRPMRVAHFPAALVATCDQLNDLGLTLLRHVFRSLGLARHEWDQVTGGAIENRGTHWFATSHYRPERDQLGCAPHKDTGFITVLYIEQDGLEASIGGEWIPIDAVPGHFLVNFGASLEILTRKSNRPVRAILHRVGQTYPSSAPDRFSFAAFVNPPASGDLYQYEDGRPVRYQSVEAFLAEFNATTWNDRHDDFGIRTERGG